MYSDAYKKRHPLAEFEAHYRNLLVKLGPIRRRNVYGVRGFSDPFNAEEGYNVDYQIFFDKSLIVVTYHLVRQPDGSFRIGSSASTSGGYNRRSLPW